MTRWFSSHNPYVIAHKHSQIIILGNRPLCDGGDDVICRLGRQQPRCLAQKVRQRILPKEFSRSIRRFDYSIGVKQQSIALLQTVRGIGVFCKVERRQHQSIFFYFAHVSLA